MACFLIVLALVGLLSPSDVTAFMMGYPPMMGLGVKGFGKGHRDMDHELEEVKLTCNNVEVSANNQIIFAVSVTVSEANGRGRSPKGHLGMMDPFLMGYGGMGHHGDRQTGSLEAKVEVISNIGDAKGLVVFTERAQPEELCALNGKADFGANLIPGENDDDLGGVHHGGIYGGYGGYGLGGFGMGLGYMGLHGLHGGFDDDFDYDSDGVQAEMIIKQGTLSSLTIGGLGFKDLAELAGRGVAICTQLETDDLGRPRCITPYVACCSLAYDNKETSVVQIGGF